MTTLALNYFKAQRGIQAKISSVSIPLVNWKKLCFVSFFASLFLLVFYVWQINDLTRDSFLMTSYEKEAGKLSQENKNLQVSFAESSFLGQALVKIHSLGFQKTTSVKYIQILNNSAQLAQLK